MVRWAPRSTTAAFINRCYDEMSLTNPDMVREIHASYLSAGAEVLTSNTFGANRIRLSAFGLADKTVELNVAGVQLAREVAGDKAWVAGSMGPVGNQLAPVGKVSPGEAFQAAREPATILTEHGVDFIISTSTTSRSQARRPWRPSGQPASHRCERDVPKKGSPRADGASPLPSRATVHLADPGHGCELCPRSTRHSGCSGIARSAHRPAHHRPAQCWLPADCRRSHHLPHRLGVHGGVCPPAGAEGRTGRRRMLRNHPRDDQGDARLPAVHLPRTSGPGPGRDRHQLIDGYRGPGRAPHSSRAALGVCPSNRIREVLRFGRT